MSKNSEIKSQKEDRLLDEEVNGPRIAALILNEMKPENKQRIVNAIAQSEPKLAVQIENNLFQFDDITELSAKGLQLLVQQVDHHDLVLSLKTASKDAKLVLFNSMSSRKAQMVREDFDSLPPIKLGEVERAQRRILEKMDSLRNEGRITTGGDSDVWV